MKRVSTFDRRLCVLSAWAVVFVWSVEASASSPNESTFLVAPSKRQARAVGSPNRGTLRNGLALPKKGPGYRRVHAKRFYGTDETIALLRYLGSKLAEAYPGSEPLLVGAISKKNGGKAGSHLSHQNGNDVDWAYLENGNPKRRYYNAKVRSNQLDYEKNWFLFEVAILTGRIKSIFVDKAMLPHLYSAATQSGWSEDALRPIFGNRSFQGTHRIIRHWPGHTYHAHVRLKCSKGDKACLDGH
jgi:murein endopeptidase